MKVVMKILPAVLSLGLIAPTMAASVKDRVEVLERRIDVVTSLSLQVENLTRENNALRGEIDLLRHDLEALKKQQREMYLDIERRLGGGKTGDDVAPSGQPEQRLIETAIPEKAPTVVQEQPSAPVAPVAVEAAADDGEEASYKKAYSLLIEQRAVPDAIAAFQQHLREFPSGPYADNAQFWLGEARYAGNDLDGAMKEFEKLVEFYTGSPKVPDALYKVGHIRDLNGEQEKARLVFEGLVEHYPDSNAAKMAAERLNRLAAN